MADSPQVATASSGAQRAAILFAAVAGIMELLFLFPSVAGEVVSVIGFWVSVAVAPACALGSLVGAAFLQDRPSEIAGRILAALAVGTFLVICAVIGVSALGILDGSQAVNSILRIAGVLVILAALASVLVGAVRQSKRVALVGSLVLLFATPAAFVAVVVGALSGMQMG